MIGMLISQKIVPSLYKQIGSEFQAFVLYLAIGSYFEIEALPELSAFFFKQADEERQHALKFIKFLIDNDIPVSIPAIGAVDSSFKDPESAISLSLEREIAVTKEIHDLVRLAKEEKDFTSDNFLQWFVKEQLEEVTVMDQLLKMIRRTGKDQIMLVEDYLARKNRLREKISEAESSMENPND
ncbi:ferritin [Candidatus Methylacidiphilum fumarolicum]|uniref:Ferritin n=3 Tax=Candidatus Methylacidiphilum fumarolicum TaxID=591154 RepID=I0K021_METFB|nr:ferritin [Candidatus Methylacidiphilum fumarolicum]CCG92840.1 Ferritin [Methylacidiphilum fumariolicum SolV]MBW6415135.1 ferritin [Candidatus Methylacidiphilum fumarolicum]TFE65985.1 ferritin [Candidatus Methylacidiphilum fumarolicum]TFE72714.1 ferritin [Candidatus Methylacidiphilum fumarolicum]TFE73180.1 ferritin [Candidatus Methylacidiphilum fumarolicum]